MKEYNFKITDEELEIISKKQKLKSLYGKFVESYGNLIIALIEHTYKHLGDKK